MIVKDMKSLASLCGIIRMRAWSSFLCQYFKRHFVRRALNHPEGEKHTFKNKDDGYVEATKTVLEYHGRY